MSENNASDAISGKLSESEFRPLSSIGFTGKSTQENATEIVIAMIESKLLKEGEVPGAIVSVMQALQRGWLDDSSSEPSEMIEKPTPAQIKKSITPDALISFIDGKRYKSLKRHLGTHGLTPEGYRARYGLDPDYPMVSPNYSAARSALAKKIGLGTGAKASA